MKSFSIKNALAALHRSPLYRHPSSYMWKRSLSVNSQFCDAVVASGFLTFEQMVDAACRYCLGATNSRGVIFWQIDREGRIHDGKLMWYGSDCHRLKDNAHKPTWVSFLLRRRAIALNPQLSTLKHISSHCFFGTHLLENTVSLGRCAQNLSKNYPENHSNLNHNVDGQLSTVCVVEAEKSAFILSEHYPEYIWLGAGGLGEVQPDKFRPLRGHRVILFPDTDSDGTTFKRWYDAAQLVMQQPFWDESPPIYVSPILERFASAEQKRRKIDLVDFLFEGVKLRV